MTEKSDKESRSLDWDKDGLDKEIIPEKTPQDRRDLAHFKFDDTSEHDYYDRAISDQDSKTLGTNLGDPISEFGESDLSESDSFDASNNPISTDTNSEFLDIGTPALVAASSQKAKPLKTKPLDASDEIVRMLRHGDIEVSNEEIQATPASTTKNTTNHAVPTSATKRLLARIFDLTWLMLLLQVSLAIFLKLVNSTAFVLVSQSLAVQLSLVFVLLPLALILEAAILSDFGNTPGKSFFGLKIIRDGQDKIKFRQHFGRACLLWFKGLACGIPFLSFLTLLWQRFQLSKHSVTSYDRSMSMQVTAVKTSFAKKFLLLLSSLLLVGLIGYLGPVKSFPTDASRAWDALQENIGRFTGDTSNDDSDQNANTDNDSDLSSAQPQIQEESLPQTDDADSTENENNTTSKEQETIQPSESAEPGVNSTVMDPITYIESAQSASSQSGTMAWQNPVTQLNTVIDENWGVTIDSDSKHSFSYAPDSERKITVTVWNSLALTDEFKTTVNKYVSDANNQYTFKDEGKFYKLDNNEVWESTGTLLQNESVEINVIIGRVNNQVWIFETVITGSRNRLQFKAERLKAAIWATL